MSHMLIVPEEIPALDEIDFELVEAEIRRIRQASGSIEHKAGKIDTDWVGATAVHYLAPNGPDLEEKTHPVKAKGGEVATGAHSVADALQGFVNTGEPIKQGLKKARSDAQALVTKARPLGETWRDKPELVEENQRIHGRVNQLLGDYEEAEYSAARSIGTVGADLSVTDAERVSDGIGHFAHPLAAAAFPVEYGTKVRYGKFAPPGGASTNWFKRFGQRMKSSNWVAGGGRHRLNPKTGGLVDNAARKAKWTKIGEWGSRAGGFVSAGTAGLDQWASDSAKYPDMSTGEKVARTGTKAAGAGFGAYAGAKGGAMAGAAIGTAVGGPVGTVIGGVVGGVAGGIIGSEVGSKVADVFNDLWSDDDD